MGLFIVLNYSGFWIDFHTSYFLSSAQFWFFSLNIFFRSSLYLARVLFMDDITCSNCTRVLGALPIGFTRAMGVEQKYGVACTSRACGLTWLYRRIRHNLNMARKFCRKLTILDRLKEHQHFILRNCQCARLRRILAIFLSSKSKLYTCVVPKESYYGYHRLARK